MHKTSTSTSRRIHWFSLLSITVLLTTAGFQVFYLRAYFRRKKIL